MWLLFACADPDEEAGTRPRVEDTAGTAEDDGVLFADDFDDGLGAWVVDAGGLEVYDAAPADGGTEGCFTYAIAGQSPAWGAALWATQDRVSISCTITLATRLDLTPYTGAALTLDWFDDLDRDWGGVRYRLFDDVVTDEQSESIAVETPGHGTAEIDLSGYAGRSAAFGVELRVAISLGETLPVGDEPAYIGVDDVVVTGT